MHQWLPNRKRGHSHPTNPIHKVSQHSPCLTLHRLGVIEQSSRNKRCRLVTGQLADKPTRGQSSRGLVNSRTSQLAKMFDLKFGVQITLFIRCQYSIGLQLGLGLCLMYKYSIVIPWFLKIRCRRVDQFASYPVRDLTDRELVCRRVVL